MTRPETACPGSCSCAAATVPIPCDDHERVVTARKDCRPAAAATVLDWRCTTHRNAAAWAEHGLAYDRAAA
jgi:hypothetical protein